MIIVGTLYASSEAEAPALFVREFWKFTDPGNPDPKFLVSPELQLYRILVDKKYTVPFSPQNEPEITLEFTNVKSSISWCPERESIIFNLRAQIDTSNPDFLELLVANNWTPVNHKQAQNLYGLTLPQLITT